jgi:hypothetical protein
MVESICGQGFAYTCEVEEDRQKKRLQEKETQQRRLIKSVACWTSPFYRRIKLT